MIDATAVRRMAEDSIALKQRFFAERSEQLVDVGGRIAASLRAGGKVLTFGNGGSAADAQHFAAELVGKFLVDRPALPALALTTDPSIMTALGNDLGFDVVFKRQVEAHGRKGDVALGISTSGRSPNVLRALEAARARGMVTIGVTGEGGGAMRDLCDHLFDVPSRETPRIQEVHLMIVHMLCQIVEESLFP